MNDVKWYDKDGYLQCPRCGNKHISFDRELYLDCDSMHYYCGDCGLVMPCTHEKCVFRTHQAWLEECDE